MIKINGKIMILREEGPGEPEVDGRAMRAACNQFLRSRRMLARARGAALASANRAEFERRIRRKQG